MHLSKDLNLPTCNHSLNERAVKLQAYHGRTSPEWQQSNTRQLPVSCARTISRLVFSLWFVCFFYVICISGCSTKNLCAHSHTSVADGEDASKDSQSWRVLWSILVKASWFVNNFPVVFLAKLCSLYGQVKNRSDANSLAVIWYSFQCNVSIKLIAKYNCIENLALFYVFFVT